MNRFLVLVVLFMCSVYCLSSSKDTVNFMASYENGQGRAVYKMLKNGERLFAIGNYTQLFDLSNMSLELEQEVNNRGTGRDGYVNGDNLYVVVRSNGAGNKYTKVPNVILDFEDNISDFEQNKGVFDYYTHEDNSYINETGIPCPNLGFYSAKLFSNNNHAAVIEKAIEKKSEAYVSLWINFENLSSNKTRIPMLKHDVQEIVSIIAYRNNDHVRLGINVGGEKEWIADSDIKMNEWYNLKIHIDEKDVELSYRSKECGSWLSLVKKTHEFNSVEISRLCLGICSSDESLVYIDDYYYHPTDIDAVSYINGTFSIYDKNSLEIKSNMHLDIRPNSISVHGNYLFLCCLRGINVYDISKPETPILVGTHRRKKYTEFQGSDIFEKDGKVYLIVSLYTKGIAVFDVTKPDQISLVKDYGIRNEEGWEKCFTFDVICQYPYAYSTFTVSETEMFTNMDHRGVLCLDLSNLKELKLTLCEIPDEVKSEITTADNQPNQITKYKNKLILNNSTKGVLIFDIGENGLPVYDYCQSLPGKSAVRAVSAFADGSLFAGDTKSGNDNYPDCGIYWYQFVENSSGISNVLHDSYYRNGWYSLSGQQLSEKPSRKGIYINGGVKVIVK